VQTVTVPSGENIVVVCANIVFDINKRVINKLNAIKIFFIFVSLN